MLRLAVIMTCVAAAIVGVNSATYYSKLKQYNEIGIDIAFCKYKGTRLMIGSDFTDLNTCVHCSCSEGGLQCEDIAMTIKAHHPEKERCVNIKVACINVWVMADDNTIPCPRDLIPKEVRGVGK